MPILTMHTLSYVLFVHACPDNAHTSYVLFVHAYPDHVDYVLFVHAYPDNAHTSPSPCMSVARVCFSHENSYNNDKCIVIMYM